MDDLFNTVFEAADSFADLLDDPDTAKRWEEPSALQGLTVGGLIAHLAMGAGYMHCLLDGPDGVTEPVVSLGQYTASMKLDDFEADLHRHIRDKNERSASHGPEPTITRLRESLSALQERFPDGVRRATPRPLRLSRHQRAPSYVRRHASIVAPTTAQPWAVRTSERR